MKSFQWAEPVNRKRSGRLMIQDDVLLTRRMCDVLHWIGFIPIRVQHRWEEGRFELIGCSPAFRECADAEVVPEYELVISAEPGGKTGYDSLDVRVVEIN